jgi:dTDP-4-dehydrorhamnose reductase
MRILVAGGHGQVGSALAQQGLEQNLDLIALGRLDLDITSSKEIASVFAKYKPELLINAAAYTSVDKAESEPELAYRINDTATGLLADACADYGIPMLHISTDYVFDGSKEGTYVETDSVCPIAIYAKSKEAGERALRERLQRHIILRTSWVFGVQGNNFVKTMVRLAKERDHLTVVCDQFGGPSSARGIAEALLTIATQYLRGSLITWGTYHYCQKPYVSWYEFAEKIVDRARSIGLVEHKVDLIPIPTSQFPTPVERPKNSRLAIENIMQSFKLESSIWYEDLNLVIETLNDKENC